jgi:adenylate kinase
LAPIGTLLSGFLALSALAIVGCDGNGSSTPVSQTVTQLPTTTLSADFGTVSLHIEDRSGNRSAVATTRTILIRISNSGYCGYP